MKCREFKRLIHEQLDARGAPSADVERALEGHGSACPACRAESLRYQSLRHAIAAWRPPPPPADFADRFLSHWERGEPAFDFEEPARRFASPWPTFSPLAVAAALLLSVLVGAGSGWLAWRRVSRVEPARVVRTIDPAALSLALAEVSSATWDLALATSAPAARVGRDVLDVAEFPAMTSSSSSPFAEEAVPLAEVFEDVGVRVNEGVRPLSGSARHAFDFLLGPAPGPPEAPSPASNGA